MDSSDQVTQAFADIRLKLCPEVVPDFAPSDCFLSSFFSKGGNPSEGCLSCLYLCKEFVY